MIGAKQKTLGITKAATPPHSQRRINRSQKLVDATNQQCHKTPIKNKVMDEESLKDESICCMPSPSCFQYLNCWSDQDETPDPVEKYTCAHCTFSASRKVNLDKHISAQHPAENEIQQQATVKQQVKGNLKLKDNGSKKADDKSSKKTEDKSNVKVPTNKKNKDVAKEPKPEWFECEDCECKYKTKSKLKVHCLKKHTDLSEIQWFYCTECPSKYMYKNELTKHMVVHGNEMLKCKDCLFQTKYKVSLKKHILCKHTDIEADKFPCEKCPLKFKTKNNLREHVQYQHGDPESIQWFECDGCDYRAKKKSDLTKHILVKHTDLDEIQWFRCEHCSFKSPTLRGLQMHITVSTHS